MYIPPPLLLAIYENDVDLYRYTVLLRVPVHMGRVECLYVNGDGSMSYFNNEVCPPQADDETHLGKRVRFRTLPKAVQKRIAISLSGYKGHICQSK